MKWSESIKKNSAPLPFKKNEPWGIMAGQKSPVFFWYFSVELNYFSPVFSNLGIANR